jgi:alpha-1,2-mannosyltransferase
MLGSSNYVALGDSLTAGVISLWPPRSLTCSWLAERPAGAARAEDATYRMREVSSDQGGPVASFPGHAGGKRWVSPAIYGVLGLELAAVIGFAATYNALDFRIYIWGGHAVTHDTRLYLGLAYGHWFTYSPFAAVVFVPIAAIPLAVARVLWDLVSVAALAYSLVLVCKLAGYRPSRITIAGVTAAAMALGPVSETLFLGQINLILLALILTDIWRASRGHDAGIGVGLAAAIKLTPAIFIVFFLLARRTKAAVIAAGTFACCGLTGLLVAPRASELYWEHLSHDTKRVGAPYISNQSPYATAIRIAGGAAHIGPWYIVIPVCCAAVGLAAATILARHDDWLGAAAATGTTGLLVSPISWAHHWVWILPALVLLVRSGRRITAGFGYLLFALAPFRYTPHSGGPREYGFHWLLTLVANCYLIAGLAFGAYMVRRAYRARTAPVPADAASENDESRLAGVATDVSRSAGTLPGLVPAMYPLSACGFAVPADDQGRRYVSDRRRQRAWAGLGQAGQRVAGVGGHGGDDRAQRQWRAPWLAAQLGVGAFEVGN